MNRSRRVLASLLATTCLVAGVGTASAQVDPASPGSAGAGDPYFPDYGNGGYDVIHYRVHDRIGFNRGRLTGRTTVRATATQALSRFNLDMMLKVRSVTVDGEQATFRKPNRHELQVTPADPIAEGEVFEVRVKYAGTPKNREWNGEDVWLGNRREVVAMGEPQIAAWWFAANDHPSDKATFDISINVAKKKKVIANGELQEVRKGKERNTWHWRAAEPMAPYLAFFGAGSFALDRGRTATGLPYAYAVSRQLRKKQRTKAFRFLQTTPKVLAFLEEWLGDYPFSTTGGLVTGLDVNFALENQTRPTYPYTGGAGSSWLVAHELAHQWFGDKVAVQNWRDIWLNEGLATYFETLWADNYGWSTPQKWLLSEWGSYPRTFWKLKIGDPGGNRMFDYPVYQRGGMAVQALRQRIGDTDFKALLRAWVTDREHGSVEDFIALAEETSGEDLEGFFDAWLFSSTRPARTVANGLS
ncbi:M1 family metallopeptidase [Nocardioides sp. JQ2195]|uniref:M1 family metallopeptidase n=1 Tax=Nocardioides sp. JQ2195 TaxID=2592334 RepID=UPI00143E3991|nr:M1 family metallopeptidase [Nocardioides sp. JQ2195]QIX26248.1 M1 family metallopeptidase [Nocardioides sp. JQ2195]